MIDLHITSSFDCVLVGDKTTVLKANYNTAHIKINKDDVFFVYPVGKGISYAVVFENGIMKQNANVDLIKNFDNEYSLTLNKYENYIPACKVEYSKFGKYVLSLIFSKPLVFQVDNGEKLYACKINDKFEFYEFLTFNNIPCLKIKNNDYEKLIYFQDECFKCLKGELSIDKNAIKVVKPLEDISRRAYECEYVYQDEKLVKKSENLIYLEGKPIYPSQEALIPTAFFQSIKCKDFSYVKNLLCDDLKKTVSPEMLKNYFGEFEKIMSYNYNKDKGFFVGISNKKQNNIYRITIKNMKICEIEKLSRNNGVDSYE